MEKKIRSLLRSNNNYKKSDDKLMARIWFDDLKHIIKDMSAIDFLIKLSGNELTKWETVTRLRRKIQSKEKDLRNETIYKLRKEQEIEWKMKYSKSDSL